MALGKGEEAARVSREVMEKHPNNAGLISNHALALLIAGHVQEAEETVQSALQLEPENQITRNLAGLIAAVRNGRVPRPRRYPPEK
jgi:Flp pilus assembly protein TadD